MKEEILLARGARALMDKHSLLEQSQQHEGEEASECREAMSA